MDTKLETFSLMPTSIDEQETVINIDYLARRARIYSSRAQVAKKMLGMYLAHKDDVELISANEFGVDVSVPLSWVIVRPKIKRKYTEEERVKLIERLSGGKSKVDEQQEDGDEE